ncbi:MAG: PH domain-containing protein [Bacteroidota bacterium]|nr:PH domain-containing protein [Bacteroidota bacterium]
MLFDNQQIETGELPRVEDIEYLPLLINYKYLLIISWTLFLIVPAGGFSLLNYLPEDEQFSLAASLGIYGGILLLYFFRLIIIIKGFPLKGYALRKHDIIFRSGLLTRKITAIPYNRIQHSEVRQSFLARLLKITKLKIYTAGGSASDLSIHGLSGDEAARIKDFLSKTICSYE